MRIKFLIAICVCFVLLSVVWTAVIACDCEPACNNCQDCVDGVCVKKPSVDCDDDLDCSGCESCSGCSCVDDDSLCIEENCEECNNGFCDTELDDWSNWSTSITVTLPEDVTNNIQTAINNIPNVNVDIGEITASYSSQKRDCCNDGTVDDDGERWREGTVTVSADIDGIKIWGPPTIDETFEISGVLKADIKIDAGVNLTADFSVSGTVGKRWDDCNNEECLYATVGCAADIGLVPSLDMSYCFEILWWEDCGSITFTPASVSVGIEGTVSYNSKTSCSAGLTGGASLKDIVFTSSFKIGGSVGLSFTRTIYSNS